MPSTIAKQYRDELTRWQQAVERYWNEAVDLEVQLEGILELDTIPERSLRAEQLLNHLALLRMETGTFTQAIQQQEVTLKVDDEPVDDSAITEQVTTSQESLRQRLQLLNQDIAAATKDVNDFLARDWESKGG